MELKNPAARKAARFWSDNVTADTYQTVILVTADGRELLYVGRPQIDPENPPKVVDIRATEPRPLPAGHEWAPADGAKRKDYKSVLATGPLGDA